MNLNHTPPSTRSAQLSDTATPVSQRSTSESPGLRPAADAFVTYLVSRNRSEATIRAYRADVFQFIDWLGANNDVATTPASVEKADIIEYLAYLGQRGVSGVSRARKLAAVREFFRYLVDLGTLVKSPAAGLQTPKKERNGRTFLHPDEYNRMLSLAGSNPRDFAMNHPTELGTIPSS